MANELDLWIYVVIEPTIPAFSVQIQSSKSVDILRKAVWQETSRRLERKGVDSLQLDLYQVCLANDKEIHVTARKKLEELERAKTEPLKRTLALCECFNDKYLDEEVQGRKEVVNVIVQLAPNNAPEAGVTSPVNSPDKILSDRISTDNDENRPSKRQRQASGSESSQTHQPEQPLSKLYDMLWGGNRSDFFKEVEYKVPTVIGDGEDTESIEAKSFELIKVSDKIFPKGLSVLLVRPEYKEMIKTMTAYSGDHFCILGASGIGKTCALSVILAERLLKKLPTTYQRSDSIAHSFTSRGYRRLPGKTYLDSVYLDHEAWHLFDSNSTLVTVPDELDGSPGKKIQAASPKVERHQEWTKQQGALQWWMSPPTWPEVYVVSMNSKTTVSEDFAEKLQYFFLKYGPNMRLCIKLAEGKTPEEGHEKKISVALDKLAQKRNWMPSTEDLGVNSSLFSIVPAPVSQKTVPGGILPQLPHAIAYSYPASRYLAKRLVEHGMKVSTERVVDMFVTLSAQPVTRTAAGKMFELLVFGMFHTLGGTFPLEPLPNHSEPSSTGETETQFSLSAKVDEILFVYPLELLDLCRKYPGRILKPGQQNFPSIDGLVYKDSKIYLLQITIGQTHGINVKGLETLYSALRCSDPTNPLGIKNWILIVVTENPSKLTSANVKGSTQQDTSKVPVWEKRLSKYVLKVGTERLYQLIPSAHHEK